MCDLGFCLAVLSVGCLTSRFEVVVDHFVINFDLIFVFDGRPCLIADFLAKHEPDHAVKRVHQFVDVECLLLWGWMMLDGEGGIIEVDKPKQTIFIFCLSADVLSVMGCFS